jgi:hypothetical protein
MQLSDLGKRRITIWERMREIGGELFLLSARSVELGVEDGHQFERWYGEGKDSDLDLPILKEDKRNAHAAVGRILWLISLKVFAA